MQKPQHPRQEFALLYIFFLLMTNPVSCQRPSSKGSLTKYTNMWNVQKVDKTPGVDDIKVILHRKLRHHQFSSDKIIIQDTELQRILHEVPSGPNPISNEIPNKLIQSEKLIAYSEPPQP